MSRPPMIVPFSPGEISSTGVPYRMQDNRIPNPLPTVIVVLSMIAAAALVLPNPTNVANILMGVGSVVLGSVLASMVRVAAQWEKALVFRLGKFQSVKGPGVFFLVPFFDSARLVDTRITTLDIPRRQAITKDNVPVSLDGVIFMRVIDPEQAVIRVRNYEHAIQEYAQTALRDIIGSMTLDEILADREVVGRRIEEMVEVEIEGWGLDVAAIRIQDIELPEDLKRVMARQASAEREKRATITKAEGDRDAAENLSAAARRMAESPGALQLRVLQTLDSLGASPSNTIVLPLPMELVEALRAVPRMAEALNPKKDDPAG